jgi:outer membrane immunogenic protein
MIRTLLVTLSAAVLASSAMAADLPATTTLPATPVPTWTGFYVGGNIGGSWGTVDTSNNTVTTNGLLTSGAIGLNAGTFPGPNRRFDFDGAFTGGFQAGYNYEFYNHVVLGIEGDFEWTGNKARDTYFATVQGPTYLTSAKAEWFSTIRGRLGYSLGSFLPYVTGGVAFVHANSAVTVAPWATLGGAASSPLDPHFAASTSTTSTGYAFGGGFEYAIAPSWSLKAEYLHLWFGSKGYDFAFGVPGTAHSDVKLGFDLARLGVNYRF